MQKFKVNNAQKGQTIIEVLIALSVAVVVIAAISISVISALYNSQFSKNQNLATQYAQEGMEILRQIRNSDWTEFSSYSGSYCLDKGSDVLEVKDLGVTNGCSSGGSDNTNIDNFFARQIDVSRQDADCSGNQTKVTATVSWSDNKCGRDKLFCHEVRLSSCFSDANLIEAP
ncbi:MAG: prepilin-type N-terminal cleavage/methylation domain-containing protein [Patescibacteria group bacterium]|nr:prepilin-type N-terminal cleavage/methylation domain-containing protein [Patescibacteria group bacterium]